jgi:glycosyltransferase involved in cell wall biosynthesis
MRILYITNGYKPHRWAGTETYTAGIAEEIANRGNTAEVLCVGDWEKGNEYWNGVSEDIQNGILVRRVNLNWTKSHDPFGYLYDNPVVAGYLEDFLRADKFDLVHVTSCETLSASVIQVVKRMGLPLVLSLTDFWFLCPRINLLHGDGTNCNGQTTPETCISCMMLDNHTYQNVKKIVPESMLLPVMNRVGRYPFLTRRRGLRGTLGNMTERKSMLGHALTLPDHRVTASSFVRNVFVSNEVTVPIAVQPYGHDLGWLISYRGKSKSNILRLGYIGQIINSKGVHLILQAFSRLSKASLDKVSLIIYGNMEHTPSYGQHLRELASGFANVTFGGTYPHSESARIFSEIDVLVVPSLWFDFPLIIYEAFATQTPVIATNLGGMAEAVSKNVNGLLFERGDAADLARQIERLLDEPELLGQLRRGIPRVKTVGDEVDELEQKYIELIRARRIFDG